MVSIAQKKKSNSISQIHSSGIHSNFILQSVIKPDMKIKLRMEGVVNGHKFEIEGDGKGKPFE